MSHMKLMFVCVNLNDNDKDNEQHVFLECISELNKYDITLLLVPTSSMYLCMYVVCMESSMGYRWQRNKHMSSKLDRDRDRD